MKKTTIGEALSPYCNPFTAAQCLQAYANALDKTAGKYGSTELTARQCLKLLGLSGIVEFLDTRNFRKWVNEQVQNCRQTAARSSAPKGDVFGQENFGGRQHEPQRHSSAPARQHYTWAYPYRP